MEPLKRCDWCGIEMKDGKTVLQVAYRDVSDEELVYCYCSFKCLGRQVFEGVRAGEDVKLLVLADSIDDSDSDE